MNGYAYVDGYIYMFNIKQFCLWDRCGIAQSGELGEEPTVNGIMGFGQGNSSMISQLAAAGKVKRSFAHCLNGNEGGGIFVIGELVQPKVKTTPMIPNMYVVLVGMHNYLGSKFHNHRIVESEN